MAANSLVKRALSGLVLVALVVGMTLAWYDPETGRAGWTFYLPVSYTHLRAHET